MKKVFIWIIFLVVVTFGLRPEKARHMAIEFSDVVNQYISFGTVSSIQGLTNKTILIWVNFDTLAGAHPQAITYPLFGSGTNEYWDIGIQNTTKKLYVTFGWTTASGGWNTNAAMTTGTHLIAITYNNANTSQDPIIYIDGASVAITENTAPSGTYRSGTTTTTFIGSTNTGFDKTIDGKILSLCIYNRILSAAEILDAYNSRLAIPDYNGLVFAPNLSAAAGLTTFDGATLAAGNTIPDQITGALGVPSGSPLAVADTLLTYR